MDRMRKDFFGAINDIWTVFFMILALPVLIFLLIQHLIYGLSFVLADMVCLGWLVAFLPVKIVLWLLSRVKSDVDWE